MRLTYQQFKELLPDLEWDTETLAEKLSLIGFETEVEDGHLKITVPTSRTDCKDFNYLVFDFAGCYKLAKTVKGIKIKPYRKIKVSLEEVNKLLGSSIDFNNYMELERLGFLVTINSVAVPQFRLDVNEAADIAEEVVRILGYKIIKKVSLGKRPIVAKTRYSKILKIKTALVSLFDHQFQLGLTETITTSFASNGYVKLKNPANRNESHLRDSLLGGLLATLAKNPYLKRAGFFEIGDIYQPNAETVLGICISGFKNIADVEKLLSRKFNSTIKLAFVQEKVCSAYGVKQTNVAFGQINIDKINVVRGTKWLSFTKQPVAKFKAISKFPPLLRDLTLELKPTDLGAMMTRLADFKNKHEDKLLIVELIDSYHPVGSDRIKYTFRFIFQNHERSFTQVDIEAIDALLKDYFLKSA